jgi:hypothetical protein
MGGGDGRETNHHADDGQQYQKSVLAGGAFAQVREDLRLEFAADGPKPLQQRVHRDIY